MDVCHLFQINNYIHTILGDKSLPQPVVVVPASPQTVGQRLVAVGRIVLPIRRVVSHLLAESQMFNRLLSLFPVTDFLAQVERMVAFLLQFLHNLQGTSVEIVPRAVVLGRPCHFGDGHHARINHVFHVFRSRNVFRPQVALYSRNELYLVGRQRVRHRVIAVYLLERKVTADGFGL